jgi:hypothetical protein
MLEAAILFLRCLVEFLEVHRSNVDEIALWLYNDVQHKLFEHLLGGMSDDDGS